MVSDYLKKYKLFPNKNEDDSIDPKVVEINKFYDAAKKSKMSEVSNWYKNIAMYFGIQAQWDTITQSIVGCSDYDIWINILFSNLNNRISRLVARYPKWEVEPEFSIAATDEQVARVTEKVIRYIEKTKDRQTLRRQIQLWNHLCGNCFEEKYWDREAGHKLPLVFRNNADGSIKPSYKDFNVSLVREGQIEQITKAEGDSVTDLWNPFEVFVDTNINSMKNATRALLARNINNNVIESTFGKDALKTDKKDKNKKPLHNSEISTPIFNDFLGLGNDNNKTQGSTLVFKWYEIPSREYPEGRLLFIINNKIVYDGINPSPNGVIPLIHRFNEDTPDKFWKVPKCNDLRQLQIEYNDIRTQMKRTRETSGNITVFTDMESDIIADQLDNYPGVVIRSDTDALGQSKTQFQPPITGAVGVLDNEIQRVLFDIQNILSVRVVEDRSRIAKNTSGIALQTLGQSDKEDMSWEIQTIEQQEIMSMQMELNLIKENYSEERLNSVIGEDSDVYDFKQSLFEYLITQIRIKPYTMLPSDIATKRNYFMQLAQYNPQYMRSVPFTTFFKELEFGGFEDYYARQERDISKALKESRNMTKIIFNKEKNIIIPPTYIKVDMLLDEHDTELNTHKDFMKSNFFKKRIKEIALKYSPMLAEQIINNLKRHIMMHQQAIMNMQQMAIQQQQSQDVETKRSNNETSQEAKRQSEAE